MQHIMVPLLLTVLVVLYPRTQLYFRICASVLRDLLVAVRDSLTSSPLPELVTEDPPLLIVRNTKAPVEKEYVFDSVFGVIEKDILLSWATGAKSFGEARPHTLPPVRGSAVPRPS
jgi:hypothetical protein